jgi:hypothetical protein
MAKIYGAMLITDCNPLQKLLDDLAMADGALAGEMVRLFETRFPNFREAVIACLKDLTMRGLNHLGEDKTVVTSTVIYLNHRVQAWPGQGADAMPTPWIKIDPDAGWR